MKFWAVRVGFVFLLILASFGAMSGWIWANNLADDLAFLRRARIIELQREYQKAQQKAQQAPGTTQARPQAPGPVQPQ